MSLREKTSIHVKHDLKFQKDQSYAKVSLKSALHYSACTTRCKNRSNVYPSQAIPVNKSKTKPS